MTTANPEAALADLESRKAEAREEQRALLADLAATLDAEDDEMVRAYWEERAAVDPDDPEVLRARADLIAKDRGVGGDQGVTVNAASAKVAAKGGRG